MSMRKIVLAIQSLQKTTKRSKKEEIVQKAWDDGLVDFFEIFRLAYDPNITFGVKQVPASDFKCLAPNRDFDHFIKLTQSLIDRKLTGTEMRDVLESWSMTCDAEVWDTVYAPCLKKDMRCGTSDSTTNPVLEKAGKKGAKYLVKPSEDADFVGVMLAKPGDDASLVGEKMLDVKLDGARLLTILDVTKTKARQFTRNGKENKNFPHILAAFEQVKHLFPKNWCFDGEIMSPTNFNHLMTTLNRKSAKATTDFFYALFDTFPHDEYATGTVTKTQRERHEFLLKLEDTLNDVSNGAIRVIPKITVDLDTPEGFKQFTDFNIAALKAKYEGIMVKDPNGVYETKRGKAWLKFKPIIEVTLKIKEFIDGEGKNAATFGSLRCEGFDIDPESSDTKHIIVDVSGFTDADRKMIWAKRAKMIGRLVEVRADCFTQDRDAIGTDVYSLRFPRFKGFRDTEANPGVKV